VRFVLTWIILAGFWVLLSGHFDVIHLTWGFVAVTLISAVSARHLFGDGPLRPGAGRVVRLFLYVPWLLWQIVLANVDVFLRVVGVRPVAPRMVRFRPSLETEFGRTAFANSITLTPGTVTVEVEDDGAFLVHAIAPEAEDALLAGEMEKRVRGVEGAS